MTTSHTKLAALGSLAALATGAALASGTTLAAADEVDSDGVDIEVTIPELDEPGVLALSIAGDSTTLAEDGSTELVRQFTGELPTVTVTDTRAPESIPDGAVWSVLGTASVFENQDEPEATIGAEHLGWSPRLLEGDGEPFVSVGGDVGSSVDGEPGLVNGELLYLTESAAGAEGGGQWSATADLSLRVPADVTPGSYTSVLTLSLFE